MGKRLPPSKANIFNFIVSRQARARKMLLNHWQSTIADNQKAGRRATACPQAATSSTSDMETKLSRVESTITAEASSRSERSCELRM